MAPDISNSVAAGIAIIAIVASMGFLGAVRQYLPRRFTLMVVLTLGWFALWTGLAASGVLARFDQRPPPLLLMFAASLGGGLILGFSPIGGALARTAPLWGLVLFQAFRVPLELCMQEAAQQGIMPPEMSIEGYNFDFLTGLTALPIAWALFHRAPSWLALGWSIFGSVCLVNIAGLAVASSPMVQAFGPAHINTWVAYFPYVWLPSVLVLLAIAGHVVVFRSLAGPRP